MKQLLIAVSLFTAVASQAEAAKILPASSAPAPDAPTSSASRSVAAATPPAAAPAPPPRQAAPSAASSGIDTGFYMGAQLGDSSVGAVMGYQFSKMIGMEISYDYFDPVYTRAVTTTIADKNRLGASMLAMFPIKFSEMGPMALYVKVGYARTTDKVTTDDPGLPPSIPASTFITTTTKTGVTGGAGIHVDMSTSASVRVGVNVVGAEHTTYLAALYRF